MGSWPEMIVSVALAAILGAVTSFAAAWGSERATRRSATLKARAEAFTDLETAYVQWRARQPGQENSQTLTTNFNAAVGKVRALLGPKDDDIEALVPSIALHDPKPVYRILRYWATGHERAARKLAKHTPSPLKQPVSNPERNPKPTE